MAISNAFIIVPKRLNSVVDIQTFIQDEKIIIKCDKQPYGAYFQLTFNGSLIQNNETNYGDTSKITHIYILNADYLLVEYECECSKGKLGKIFSWNGTLIQSGIELGINLISIRNDIHDKFCIANYLPYENMIKWTIYNNPTKSNETFNQIYDGKFGLKRNLTSHLDSCQLFQTIEGGFGFAYVVNNSLDANITRSLMYVTFWKPEITYFGPHYLLDEDDENDLRIIECGAQTADLGYYCNLLKIKNKPVTEKNPKFQIVFLRNGGVLKYDELYDSGKSISLAFGGKINETFGSDNNHHSRIFEIQLECLTKQYFLGCYTRGEQSYNIFRIFTTFLKWWNKINITYYNKTTLSNNNNHNISVYQVNLTAPILRQTLSGNPPYCSVDDKTVTVTLFNSTFNELETEYFIVVDNNFVKDLEHNDAYRGIGRNIWRFKTEKDLTGLLRLNQEGTENFTKTEEKEFFGKLEDQLALTIPVERKGIKIMDHKTDRSDSKSWEILQLRILSESNSRNPMKIAEDLKIILENKWATGFSKYPHTAFLDEKFGFQVTREAYF
ncbi:hypothetical protein G9A89_021226 [Geosiphon pyriformis]|nr:hypothetical protein G9A89_021226 [Geosiphon pyriformis]